VIAATRLIRHIGRAPELVVASRHTPAAYQLVRHYLEIGKREYPFVLPLSGGGSLVLSSPAEVSVFWNIFVHGSYRLPARCKTILDCGANVGIFSVWAARKSPAARIVALEPFPETFASLTSNIRANALDDRVRCEALALAAQRGEGFISLDGASPNHKLLPQDVAPARMSSIAIKTTTLADVMAQHGFDLLDYMKMDIEGSEWEVLLSTPVEVLRRIRSIQLEYHQVHARFGYTPAMLFRHLAAAGHQAIAQTEDRFRTGLAYFERSDKRYSS
jgi:FkbM family methyltransferase